MGVAISRRGPKLVLASLLAGGALVASATAALAWSPPEVTVNCTQVIVTLTDHGGDYAKHDSLTFFRLNPTPGGKSRAPVIESYTWTQGENTTQTFQYPIGDFPPDTYEVSPTLDTTATSRTFEIPPADCQPAQVPPASSPRTNPPSTPAPSGGGAGTPGLPNTGFDPSD
jgi:uncharacterized protein (DUF697 family)